MGLKSFVFLALLAFSSIAAAILPKEECGYTETVIQTVTETTTKILCETSSTSVVTISTSTPSTLTSTTSEITTIIETSTTTETFTLKQPTVTVPIQPLTSQQSQPAPSEAPIPTSLPSGISGSQKPVPSSTTVAPIIAITTTTSPPPPYANSTTSIPTSQINGTTVSRGGGFLSTITRTGAFYSSYPFSRTISGTGHSSLSTLQTSISSHTRKPHLSHSSAPITTHSSSTAVPATSSQTPSPLTSSAITTTSLAPTPSGVSTSSHIPYISNPLSLSTTVDDNSAVDSATSRSSSAYSSSSMTTSPTPSSESRTPAVYATTIATKEPSKPEYFSYGSKINKRHRGGGENSEEGEGYWGNARRV